MVDVESGKVAVEVDSMQVPAYHGGVRLALAHLYEKKDTKTLRLVVGGGGSGFGIMSLFLTDEPPTAFRRFSP